MTNLEGSLLERDGVLISGEWKFLYQGAQKQFDYLLGKCSISEASIVNYTDNIRSRSKYFSDKKIDYLHIVFPSKPLLAKSELPEKLKNIESLYNKFPAFNEAIYPDNELVNYQSMTYKSDTHYKPRGSWAVLMTVLKKLGIENIHPPEFSDGFFNGDLNLMLGKNEPEEVEKFVGLQSVPYCSFDFNNHSALKGNTGRIRVLRNPLALHKKRILIFGDSFININLLSQMSVFFGDILFFRSPVVNYEVVRNYCPDIVITGQAERYLVSVPSDDTASSLLSEYMDPNMFDSSKVDEQFTGAFLSNVAYRVNLSKYKAWAKNVDYKIYLDLAVKSKGSSQKLKFYILAHNLKPSELTKTKIFELK